MRTLETMGKRLLASAAGLALLMTGAAPAGASGMNVVIATVNVLPTDNPFLADPANVPDQLSDILDGTVPSYIELDPNCPVLMFKAHGGVANDPQVTIEWGPDGSYVDASSLYGAQGGISDYNVPMSSLVGVFVGDPPLGSPPAALPYDTMSLSFSPTLGQVFFIGDGVTGFNINQGDCQMWTVPVGAKRLYFAVADTNDWSNNVGNGVIDGFELEVHCEIVPEPASWALAAAGLGLSLLAARRRR